MKTEASDFIGLLAGNLSYLKEASPPLWHPLGFVSGVIEDVQDQHVVRIHYWPQGERRVKNPDWPIHTHAYALSSLILDGSVRDLQYRALPGDTHSIYEVNYYEGGSEIVKTSKTINLSTEIDAIRKVGDQYRVEKGVFHQTQVPRDSTAVTLAVLTDHGANAPQVLGTSAEVKYPYNRVLFDREVFWEAVENCLPRHLTNGCG